MNTHYVIPGTVALALHAAVFLGFGRSHHLVNHGPTKVATLIEPFVLPPELEIVDVRHADEEVPRGAPDVRPDPVQIERPPTPNDIPMPQRPVSPNDVDIRRRISWETPGLPEGKEFADPTKIISIASLDKHPNARTQIPPEYPYAAKSAGLTGTVVVEFIVDTTGRVHDANVVNSTDRIFNEAAVRAILRWRFEPGKSGGRVVSFRMAVPVVFTLSDE